MLQYAKLRVLGLYYSFFDKYYDVARFEELEMDTDSFYLALSEYDFFSLYPTSKEKRVELFAKWRLNGWTFSQFNNKFLPSYLLS